MFDVMTPDGQADDYNDVSNSDINNNSAPMQPTPSSVNCTINGNIDEQHKIQCWRLLIMEAQVIDNKIEGVTGRCKQKRK